jgi:hypothetical protein
MRHRGIRVKAFLLLAVFLSAGSSLPSADAVLYHNQAPDAKAGQAHVETAGGCLDHAEHCVLGRTATGSSTVVPLLGEIRVTPSSRAAVQRPAAAPVRGYLRGAIPQPRAPPTLRNV